MGHVQPRDVTETGAGGPICSKSPSITWMKSNIIYTSSLMMKCV